MAFVLATFNVLDLFDVTDAPRIERMAALLLSHAPDVIALQEVGSEDALAALETALGGGFARVLGDPDERGIRNVLLSRRSIVSSTVLRADHLPFPRFRREDPEPFGARIPLRRSVPDVVVDAGDLGRVRILVVHFKSRRGTPMREADGTAVAPMTTAQIAACEARAVSWRSAEALFVREAIDAHLQYDANEKLVVCGDFNDVSGSLPLRIVAGTAGTDVPRLDALVSCAEVVPLHERISVMHNGEPAAIDHALLSPALAAHLELVFYERSGLCDTTTDGAVYASDHAPLVARFV